jgi:hypothetical protein
MPKNIAAKASSRDPLKTVADALDTAVKAAKDGAADAKVTAGKMLPAAGRFLSRFVYTTSYTFSYGVVFPAVLIAKSIPVNNAVVHGFVDGAQAANDMVLQVKNRRLQSPVASKSPGAAIRTRTRTTKAKRKTTR